MHGILFKSQRLLSIIQPGAGKASPNHAVVLRLCLKTTFGLVGGSRKLGSNLTNPYLQIDDNNPTCGRVTFFRHEKQFTGRGDVTFNRHATISKYLYATNCSHVGSHHMVFMPLQRGSTCLVAPCTRRPRLVFVVCRTIRAQLSIHRLSW